MPPADNPPTPKSGVLLQAENGPVIEFDDLGLVMRLSDRVVADLARRLQLQPDAPAAGPVEQAAPAPVLDAAVLGDIDAWDVQAAGDWLRFLGWLPGADGARRYRRHKAGGGIIAETPGPVQGLLTVGGPRRMTTQSGGPRFAHHVVHTPTPDEGEPDFIVSNLRNWSVDTAIADEILAARHEVHRALPLILTLPVLCAPDEFGADEVLARVDDQVARWADLAARLDKPARLLAVGVELGPDHGPVDADLYHRQALGFLDALATRLDRQGLGQVRFIAVADCGPWWMQDGQANRAALLAQQKLALCSGVRQLCFAAPSYIFDQDDLGQPTPEAMIRRAQIEAIALQEIMARRNWTCPILCLAERQGDDVIRAVFKSDQPLVLDAGDPFGAGPQHGFALRGCAATIADIQIAPDDPRSLLISVTGDLSPLDDQGQVTLEYAMGAPSCGSLRDDWQHKAADGQRLHRWALPGNAVVW